MLSKFCFTMTQIKPKNKTRSKLLRLPLQWTTAAAHLKLSAFLNFTLKRCWPELSTHTHPQFCAKFFKGLDSSLGPHKVAPPPPPLKATCLKEISRSCETLSTCVVRAILEEEFLFVFGVDGDEVRARIQRLTSLLRIYPATGGVLEEITRRKMTNEATGTDV